VSFATIQESGTIPQEVSSAAKNAPFEMTVSVALAGGKMLKTEEEEEKESREAR
jgi:hypothetical protein